MKNFVILITIFLYIGNLQLNAQTNFKLDLKNANPIKDGNTFSDAEKLKIHLDYLKKAIATKNIKMEFYGHLYLFVDYYKNQNYIELSNHLNEADRIAKASNNASWQGAIYLRRGVVSDVVNTDYEDAIKNYKISFEFQKKAKDSLLMGECLEQASSMYKYLDKYDSAHYYFKMALPFLQKFGDRTQMASTYNNYSNLLSAEGDFPEALQYIDSAIQIAKSDKNIYKEMLYTHNLGAMYSEMKQYDAAIKTYQNCISINNKNNYTDHLSVNYLGLSEAYEMKGDYKNAFNNLKTFYLLKDSIAGVDVQLRITELNKKFEVKDKELALVESKQALQRRNFLLFFISFLVLFGIISWWLQIKRKQKEILQHKENLKKLSKILVDKYTDIIELQNKLKEENKIPEEKSEQENEDLDLDIFSQRILTTDDWSLFKSHFEKAYPNYINRLRTTYSKLTEAEERLFILIKLNLNSKEIAAMLGISVDSVKKTRNRLRKRLQLTEEINLDDFVMKF